MAKKNNQEEWRVPAGIKSNETELDAIIFTPQFLEKEFKSVKENASIRKVSSINIMSTDLEENVSIKAMDGGKIEQER